MAGALTWNELMTTDSERSATFYGALFGWQTRTVPGAADQPYTLFILGERSVAGMIRIQPEWGPVPTNWSLYFAVDDLDAARERVLLLGGHLETPVMEAADARFCLVSDPQGVHFELIEGGEA